MVSRILPCEGISGGRGDSELTELDDGRIYDVQSRCVLVALTQGRILLRE